jgi:hypothetical protein
MNSLLLFTRLSSFSSPLSHLFPIPPFLPFPSLLISLPISSTFTSLLDCISKTQVLLFLCVLSFSEGNLYDPTPVNFVAGTPVNVTIFSSGMSRERGEKRKKGGNKGGVREQKKTNS